MVGGWRSPRSTSSAATLVSSNLHRQYWSSSAVQLRNCLRRHNITDGLHQQGNTPPPLVHKDGHPASSNRLICKTLYRRHRPRPLRRQRPRHRRRHRSCHLRRQRLHQSGITIVMTATWVKGPTEVVASSPTTSSDICKTSSMASSDIYKMQDANNCSFVFTPWRKYFFFRLRLFAATSTSMITMTTTTTWSATSTNVYNKNHLRKLQSKRPCHRYCPWHFRYDCGRE